ncbi:MAG TPA: helix-turn-helix domain-containing protein [Chitinophagaceae bacterium]|nr:helix-turn-helix domain-containing protein [Chitinophagaceae bacterium]
MHKTFTMKLVTIVVPKGKTNVSCITGSFNILNSANEHWKKMGNRPMMEITIAGFVTELKLDTGFFSIHPVNITETDKPDLVIIPAISYDDNLMKENADLITWIREQYKDGAEVATMCSGVFLLAATGLLEGRNCSTHWNLATNFKRLFPNINLLPDKLITAERGIYTNGGAYSFLNLLLFLVEKYFDRETAIYCSKIFQIDMERTSQSPFHIFQAQKTHDDELVYQAQTYIEQNLSEKISFEELASKLATSRRNFDRRFIKATGNTPVEYLQRVKVEAAKSTLEKGRKSVFEVMYEVGYSDDKAFREVFRKITGMSPLEYKWKYNKEAIA